MRIGSTIERTADEVAACFYFQMFVSGTSNCTYALNESIVDS